MPRLFNVDHQAAVLGLNDAVQPGESRDFTDEEAAGLLGLWSDEDPRAGLDAELEFKRLRDASRAELDEEARSLGIDPSGLAKKADVIAAIRDAKTHSSDPGSEEDAAADSGDELAGETPETNPAEPGNTEE
jgi:thioesterase domain-containing protein